MPLTEEDTASRRLGSSKPASSSKKPSAPLMSHARARVRRSTAGTGSGAGIVSTLDETSLSFDAVMTTEAPVLVADPYRGYEPIEEALLASGGIFPKRMPLLDSHWRGRYEDLLGGAGAFRREGTEWIGRCSLTPGVQESVDAFRKVAAGHLTDVSIGYVIAECVEINPSRSEIVAGKRWTARDYPLRICTRWVVKELSLTPIGADEGAKIRHQHATQNARMRSACHEELLQLFRKLGRVVRGGASPTGRRVQAVCDEIERVKRLQNKIAHDFA